MTEREKRIERERLAEILLPLFDGRITRSKCIKCDVYSVGNCTRCAAEYEADYLLANGVTVKEPVPANTETCAVCGKEIPEGRQVCSWS